MRHPNDAATIRVAAGGVAGLLVLLLAGCAGIRSLFQKTAALPLRFSADMGLHVMEVPAAARAVVRSNHVVWSGPGERPAFSNSKAGIRFAGAERIDREVVHTSPSEPRVVFDLTMVSSIDDVARASAAGPRSRGLPRRLGGDDP